MSGAGPREENERLVAELMERTREAERARRSAERLQDLTAGLSEAVTPAEVGETVMRRGVAALGADAGVLALLTPGGDELEIFVSVGYAPEACMGPGRRWPAGAGMPIEEAARTGEPVCVASPEEWGERYLGGYVPARRASASRAWAALPVAWGGAPRGALLWTYNAPRGFGADEAALMLAVARLCSQALERAGLYEAAERARAEAEAANLAKTEFLSMMSHELRTPLNAIAGYVELVELEIHGPVTEAQRRALGRVRHSQRLLLSLINDVLNFARVEAGRLELRPRACPLAELLAGAEALVAPLLRARSLEYACEPGDPGLAAWCDPERAQQVLMNLLGNAVKFTPAGGRVAVWAGGEGERVVVKVSDTGRGIPADRLETVFDPFVQIDRHRTDESQQGVGLGLAISRELARAMGGDLAVESEEGVGSVFTLTLPAAPAADPG